MNLTMEINYQDDRLPDHIKEGLKVYIEQGRETGGFLRAVLCNDLVTAIGTADDENKYKLGDIVSWIYNEAPADCWGSIGKVEAWINKGGLTNKQTSI